MMEQVLPILFPEDNENTFAVVDGGACEELLDKLAEFDPECVCLYAGELEPDVAEVAPYLIALRPAEAFTEWYLGNCFGQNWGIFARSPESLRSLRKHLRSLLLVKAPDAKTLYFRYYDPRVLSIFLPTTSANEREVLFGIVSAYLCDTGQGEFVRFRRLDSELDQQICLGAAKLAS
jgi:hypothetical protein